MLYLCGHHFREKADRVTGSRSNYQKISLNLAKHPDRVINTYRNFSSLSPAQFARIRNNFPLLYLGYENWKKSRQFNANIRKQYHAKFRKSKTAICTRLESREKSLLEEFIHAFRTKDDENEVFAFHALGNVLLGRKNVSLAYLSEIASSRQLNERVIDLRHICKLSKAKYNEQLDKDIRVYKPCHHDGECTKESCTCIEYRGYCDLYCKCRDHCLN